jgi:ubiquinone/menaquinone biosynthesis C-methylase UbiE
MDNRQEFFNQLSSTWEEKNFSPDTRRRIFDLVQSFQIRKGDWVADVGTGTGILHPYLLKKIGEMGRLFAFDLSFEMIREAKKKPSGPNCLCFQANVNHIPLPDGICDHVICFAAFPHFTGKPEALREMTRVAKIGAHLVIAHLMSREELSKHHGSQKPVAGDRLPEKFEMRKMFLKCGLTAPEIWDEPGMYLAEAIKI